ncbi:MAG: B12-binding domain-containing radical SAM protein [Promethearchaeota archaeon]
MKKVFLITPPKTFREDISLAFRWVVPHVGLGYLSSYISQFGYDVQIFDLSFFPLRDFLEKVRTEKPRVVGITAITEEYYAVKRILALVKRVSPSTVTVLGGSHATALPRETLEDLDNLDFVVFGEGEITLKELLDEIFSTEDYSTIKGIAYKSKNTIILNEPRELVTDLDDLPFPDWEKFDLSHYSIFASVFKKRKVELPMVTQRGCPYQCIFCQKLMGNRVRKRSTENLINEIVRDIELFHVNQIAIVDDTFTLDKKRVIEFCQKIRELGLHKKITWSCLTRVDLVDEELIKHMKLAGCQLISFGVESGNPHILKIIKKNISLEQVKNALNLMKKYQIEVHYGIIFGHPFETVDTMRDSLRFALKNRPDMITFSLLVPFPGTKVRTYCKNHYGGLKCIAKDWYDYDKQMGRAIELIQIPRNYLDLYQTYAYLRFFLHPHNIRNIFRLVKTRSILKFLIEKLKGILHRH